MKSYESSVLGSGIELSDFKIESENKEKYPEYTRLQSDLTQAKKDLVLAETTLN